MDISEWTAKEEFTGLVSGHELPLHWWGRALPCIRRDALFCFLHWRSLQPQILWDRTSLRVPTLHSSGLRRGKTKTGQFTLIRLPIPLFVFSSAFAFAGDWTPQRAPLSVLGSHDTEIWIYLTNYISNKNKKTSSPASKEWFDKKIILCIFSRMKSIMDLSTIRR